MCFGISRCCASGQAFSRTYGRLFAEFLNEDSPVHLGVLHQPTCVGFRYGLPTIDSRRFSRKRALRNFPRIAPQNFLCARNRLAAAGGFACRHSLRQERKSNNPFRILRSVTPSKSYGGHGILTVFPSPSAFAIGLGPTNPQMIVIAAETLGFRCRGVSPRLWLLVPTFSLPAAPVALTGQPSLQRECSSTTHSDESERIRDFGTQLSPVESSAQRL